MRRATEKQGKAFLQTAQTWFKNTNSAVYFGDVKSVAIRAIAEYLASQEGYSLFRRIK